MNIYQDSILESIELLVNQKIKEIPFNYTIECKILSVSGNNYTILHNNDEYKAKAINNQTYTIDDLVYVLVLNNGFSNKIILCKIP